MLTRLSFNRIGPRSGTLNLILWLIASIAIVSALLDPIINYFTQMPGPQDWFCLSWYGIKKWYIWQPLSYLFVLYSGYNGLTFTFFLSLIFYLVALYIIASLAIERIGTTSFLFFFLVQGALSGVITLILLPITGHLAALAGPIAPLFGLLVVWTLFNPESDLFILKAKWLTIILLSAFLITTASLPYTLLTLIGAFLGYLYALFSWELKSPFLKTHKFDKEINKLGIQYRNRFKTTETPPIVLNDTDFINAILSKIAKSGESSLTLLEKKRLDELIKK